MAWKIITDSDYVSLKSFKERDGSFDYMANIKKGPDDTGGHMIRIDVDDLKSAKKQYVLVKECLEAARGRWDLDDDDDDEDWLDTSELTDQDFKDVENI